MESTTLNLPHSACGRVNVLEKMLSSGPEQHLLYQLVSRFLLISLLLTYSKISGPIISAVFIFSAFFLTFSCANSYFPKTKWEWFATGSQVKSLLVRVWANEESLKFRVRW